MVLVFVDTSNGRHWVVTKPQGESAVWSSKTGGNFFSLLFDNYDGDMLLLDVSFAPFHKVVFASATVFSSNLSVVYLYGYSTFGTEGVMVNVPWPDWFTHGSGEEPFMLQLQCGFFQLQPGVILHLIFMFYKALFSRFKYNLQLVVLQKSLNNGDSDEDYIPLPLGHGLLNDMAVILHTLLLLCDGEHELGNINSWRGGKHLDMVLLVQSLTVSGLIGVYEQSNLHYLALLLLLSTPTTMRTLLCLSEIKIFLPIFVTYESPDIGEEEMKLVVSLKRNLNGGAYVVLLHLKLDVPTTIGVPIGASRQCLPCCQSLLVEFLKWKYKLFPPDLRIVRILFRFRYSPTGHQLLVYFKWKSTWFLGLQSEGTVIFLVVGKVGILIVWLDFMKWKFKLLSIVLWSVRVVGCFCMCLILVGCLDINWSHGTKLLLETAAHQQSTTSLFGMTAQVPHTNIEAHFLFLLKLGVSLCWLAATNHDAYLDCILVHLLGQSRILIWPAPRPLLNEAYAVLFSINFTTMMQMLMVTFEQPTVGYEFPATYFPLFQFLSISTALVLEWLKLTVLVEAGNLLRQYRKSCTCCDGGVPEDLRVISSSLRTRMFSSSGECHVPVVMGECPYPVKSQWLVLVIVVAFSLIMDVIINVMDGVDGVFVGVRFELSEFRLYKPTIVCKETH